MRAFARRWTPSSLRGRVRQLREQRRNRHRTAEEVFTEIYEQNRWGGRPGEFYSGADSGDPPSVQAWVSAVTESASREGFLGCAFVDLGCGDFRVARHLLPLCSRYVGVDLVASLIDRNEREFGNETTRFTRLDIVSDALPEGDVCFVRHVLQHLSNEQIAIILGKLASYRWVFITEHHPVDDDRIRPNLDRVHGGYTRVCQNSGVYLTEPPFSLPKDTLSLALEAPEPGEDAGIARTYLYEPRGTRFARSPSAG